ncbi:hypothetical protein ACEWY4_012260 [Coilia grayii]|uniref:Uncharacterized protein n=1 Tax=Coilia grayii TaxID=363190 RepID=A0ABD1K000_9TELE
MYFYCIFSISELDNKDYLRCSVCTGVLRDPVSIPCGHSYCRQCIASYWAQPNHAGHYACPKCRKRFRTRPEINSSASMPRQLQLAGASSGGGPIACDFCMAQKVRAVKFCVTCTALYCETHVRQHYTIPVLQRHTLVETTQPLQQTKKSSSPSPSISTVRSRQSSTADAEVENRELRMKNKVQQEVIMQLRKAEANQKTKEAKREQKHAEEVQQMAEIISTLETHNARLKRENNKMRKKIAKLNNTSQQQNSDHPLMPVIGHKKRHPLPARVVLDSRAAHRRLVLSEDRRSVKLAECPRISWNQQQGLNGRPFALGEKGFTSGRRFWQVGVNNQWIIGVTRASAQRTGNVTFYPNHGYWCLSRWITFSALTTPMHCLPESAVPRELGVCLDVDEKWVSFYNAESKAHIYTFTNMDFSEGEEIYPVFCTQDKEQEIKIRKQPNPHCPIFVSDQRTVSTDRALSPLHE